MYLFGIHLKAIQIAVSHFLYQELEGIHAHSHPFIIIHEPLEINNFISSK